MNDIENEKNTETESSEKEEQKGKEPKKSKRKTQTQLLQEALGLEPDDTKDVEKKLFLARFFDYFSEEPFDFIYKDRSIELYKKEINNFLENIETAGTEEDKLLKKSLEGKDIIKLIIQLKEKAEELAFLNGIKKPVEKRLRIISLVTTLPIFGVLIIIMIFNLVPIWYLFPILCVLCMAPQLVRGSILRKWHQFKEEHRNEFYSDNRSDVMILKGCTQEFLDNIRNKLIDLKVPLQLIKFVLHSRDFENLDLINEKTHRGAHQYFFSFAYPEGMEPFPIPDIILQQQPELMDGDKPEKNFIVLTEMKGKSGIISSFIPTLKTELSDKINTMLNECDFTSAPTNFKEIIPNYSLDLGIFCLCGEITEIINSKICNYKSQFKFYLFEAEKCECGEKIYALSLMDEVDKIPDELKEIF